MPQFLQKIFKQSQEVIARLSTNQKIGLIIGLLFVILAFSYLIHMSSQEGQVLLYPEGLEKADFQRAQSQLEALGIAYTSTNDRYLYVSNEELATKARAQLGISGVVRDVNGFELFNNPKFSMTDFERRINLRRAITGNLVRHLEALDDIDKAEVTISYGEGAASIYRNDHDSNPLTASVSIKPAAFSDIHENKKKIRGIRDFIAKGVDRLKPEHVIILEQGSGAILTEKIDIQEDDANISRAREQLQIKERIRMSKIKELRSLLSMFPEDRYQVSVDLDINWDVKNTVIQGIEPVVLKNPHDTFDKGKVLDGVIISEQEVKENFDGPSYIPEGPAGVEPNVAPGTKELIDRYTKYKRTTKTKNKEVATRIEEQKNQPYQILSFHTAIALDGLWVKVRDTEGELQFNESGGIQRKYTPIPEDELKRLQKLVQAAFSKKRGDVVELRHFQFDRSKEFEIEDEQYRQKLYQSYLFTVSILSFIGFIVFLILFSMFRRYILRRRRIKEEQLAREQQAMREANMLSAQDDGISLDIPPEDRARLEMQENAIAMAREKPEDVAQLIRTWIAGVSN